MRPDGEDVRQITNGSQSDSSPSWSPDGKLVAFTRCDSSGPCRDEITTPDGSEQRLLSRNSWPPTWSPDGRKILFRCDLGACWVRPTGGRLHPLVAVNRKLKAHIGLSDDDMFFDWQAR
jgi:Tol biopolymer transport system component